MDLEKLYVTPAGTFGSMKDLRKVIDVPRRTLYGRFSNHRDTFKGWFIMDEETPLSVEDMCTYCDEVDELLFAEDCWLDCVGHIHSTAILEDDTIAYLYKGFPYQVQYGSWLRGDRPHLIKGEDDDKCDE